MRNDQKRISSLVQENFGEYLLKTGLGLLFCFKCGDGFHKAGDGERVAYAARAAYQVQRSALPRQGDG